MKKKNKIWILICIVSIFFLGVFITIIKNTRANDIVITNNYTYSENVYEYNGTDGIHKIYWAQGINPPKMTLDESLIGSDGYFGLELLNGYETYMSEFIPNNGYFDYNKNLTNRGEEHPLCYLGAASNLISWWLNQNKDLVNQYISRLETSDIYGQDEKLRDILPFNRQMWTDILSDPGTEVINGYNAQMLGVSPLVTKYLNPYYYKKDNGYYSDMVFDFFFNGYDAIPSLDVVKENNENNYIKDKRGGYFAPIFGNHRLTSRIIGPQVTYYENLGNSLRKYFAQGKGIVLNYNIHSYLAHAITVWGVEFDSNNNLKRIFFTDSDDNQPFRDDDLFWRGIVGMNVVPDSKGMAAITSKIDYDKTKPGVYIQSIVTLDLSKDLFKNNLDDITKPGKPIINKEPEGGIYAKGANITFSVDAESTDRGYLEYEWFIGDSVDDVGTKINGERNNSISIITDTIGIKYYYCNVYNNKNGYKEVSSTHHFKVDTQDILLENAETPVINFNYNTVTYDQYDTPKKIYVDASIKGKGNLTYQWYLTNTSESNNGRLLDGETNNYIIPDTSKATNGLYYYCIVTNTDNFATGNNISSARTKYAKRIIVKEKTLIDAQEPIITLQPESITVEKNKSASLMIEAESLDSGVLKYEWYQVIDNKDILIGNNNSNILNVDTSIAGTKNYKVKVINYNSLANNIKEKYVYSNTVVVSVFDRVLSNDNELKNFVVKNATLKPKFDKSINNYTAMISHSDNQLDASTTIATSAHISVDNPSIGFGESKNYVITITAENGDVNTYTIRVTRSNEHTYNDWQIESKETCTTPGSMIRTCPICGHVEKKTINALGHDFSPEWIIEKEPTYTETGIKYHKCKRCGEKKDITVIPKLEHKTCEFGEWEIVSPPTCTSKGLRKRVCNICGKVQEEIIPEIEHDYGVGWEIIKEPSCNEQGIMKRTCKVCGKSEEAFIDKLGHDFSPEWIIEKEPTYTETGIKYHKCKRCGEKKDITVIPKLEHKTCEFDEWEIVSSPTCTSKGLKKRVCNICGKVQEEIIPEIEHDYGDGWEIIKEATCTSSGLKRRTCSMCGKTEEIVIEPLGHDFSPEWIFDKKPTHEEEGIKSHHCKRCGERKDITSVPKIKEHKTCKFGDWYVVKEPTCTNSGLKRRTCSVCGKTEEVVIEPIGHDFSDKWTIDKKPTYEEEGIKSHHCKRCDEKRDITNIPKLDKKHECSYGEWIIIKEPTYNEVGLRKKICTICGKEITEEIPMLKKDKNNNFVYIISSIGIISIASIGIIILGKRKKLSTK